VSKDTNLLIDFIIDFVILPLIGLVVFIEIILFCRIRYTVCMN